jgi:hypothetical protein
MQIELAVQAIGRETIAGMIVGPALETDDAFDAHPATPLGWAETLRYSGAASQPGTAWPAA